MICNKIAGACSSARCLLKSVTLTRSGANGFHMSSPLQHDPTLKKKKKLLLDPKLVRKREKQEAKRRLEPILVPMDPDSVADPVLFENSRKRPAANFTVAEIEERVLLSKEWSSYSLQSHRNELLRLQVKARSRQDALRELKKISVDLFNQAITVNPAIFPLTLSGPVESLPIQDYIPPDLDDMTLRRKK